MLSCPAAKMNPRYVPKQTCDAALSRRAALLQATLCSDGHFSEPSCFKWLADCVGRFAEDECKLWKTVIDQKTSLPGSCILKRNRPTRLDPEAGDTITFDVEPSQKNPGTMQATNATGGAARDEC